MRTRLFASLGGGLLGLAVASPINASLDLPKALAFLGCSLAGLVVGYVGSMMFDVFAGQSGPDRGDSGG